MQLLAHMHAFVCADKCTSANKFGVMEFPPMQIDNDELW